MDKTTNNKKEEFCRRLRSTGRDGVEKILTMLEELGFFKARRAHVFISAMRADWWNIP